MVVNFTSCVFSKMAEAFTLLGPQKKVSLHKEKASPMLHTDDRGLR